MFGKKIICDRCGSKAAKKFSYCPFCGNRIAEEGKKESNEGLLFDDSFDKMFHNSLLSFPFNSLIKQIDMQMRDLDRQLKESKKEKISIEPAFTHGISISVNMSGSEPVIKVRRFGNKEEPKKEKEPRLLTQLPKKSISEEKAQQLARLPKQEPSATVRRLSNKVIYEIDLPGVKKENIIINKLQNSIEIKAFSADKAFFKLIPVSLPIQDWQFKAGKLVLELKPEA